jgi:two-component system sensor histidine kinase KdpD
MTTSLPSQSPRPSDTPRQTALARLRAGIVARSARVGEMAAEARRDPGALVMVLRMHLQQNARGYAAAVLGVAVISLLIGLIHRFIQVSNISLLYLFVVLWLARQFGRWPAVLASVLAFLAYDYFFIPPVHFFTVDDPAEWVSLSALLVTALVLGQLTAAVEARRREAVESQQRTATLYALAQLIASTTGEQALLDALVGRIVQVFATAGVEASALILSQGTADPQVRATSPARSPALEAFNLAATERMARAREAMERGRPAAGHTTVLEDGMLRELYWRYIPLRSGEHIVGILAIAGSPGIRRLRVEAAGQRTQAARTGGPERRSLPRQHQALLDERDAQAALFAAFCDQIALALERADLRRQAIHAEALRESDRLKTALLGSVTHDLRTPLASIKAATTSLLEPGTAWSDADRHELLESIDMSVDRLNRLVSNLLDLSRLEGGAATPEKDWYPIGDVLATVLDRLELSGQLRDHRIEVDIPSDLPLVPLDYTQMEEVFTNLLENGIKYSPAGSVIRVQARALPSAELEVRVTDQGIGIPKEELQAIFDRFYRVQHVRLPWTNRPPIGTGLGLAICAGIIHAHGGRIWAESTLGHGATFIFTLPIPTNHPQGSLPEVDANKHQPAAAQPSASSEASDAGRLPSKATT